MACPPPLTRHFNRRTAGSRPFPNPPDRTLTIPQYATDPTGPPVHTPAEPQRMVPKSVSALFPRLTEAGLLERRQDDTDKRVAHLRVTATARQRIGEVENFAAAYLASALRTLTEGDRAALGSALGALEALTRRLRDHAA